MAEPTPPNPGQSDDDKDSSGAADADKNKPEMISRAEAEKSFKERDKLKEEKRRLQADFEAYKAETGNQLSEFQARLKEIEDGKTAAEEEAARKSGDVEKLTKTWDGQKTELQKQIEAERKAREKEVGEWQSKHDGLAKKYHSNLVERELRNALDGISRRPKAALVFLQKDYEFEPVENDEGQVIGVKPKDSDKSIAEIHKEICAKYDLDDEKNDRANGSGAQPANGDGGNSAVRLPSNWGTMSKDDKQKWFQKNPTYKPG